MDFSFCLTIFNGVKNRILDFLELLKLAIKASIHAGIKILEVYNSKDIKLQSKQDSSPLTAADIVSNQTIMDYLKTIKIPIISEENKEIDYLERKKWPEYWIVDPLDGTKEFIKRNAEFTVNIALVMDGRPILGIIYAPVTGELYYSDVSKGAFKTIVLGKNEFNEDALFDIEKRLYSSKINKQEIRVVGSRSHMNEDTTNFVGGLKSKYKNVEIVSKGSSLKFCLVAEGKADIYPRFAPTMEWDTAAGQAICNAVGLKVLNQETEMPLLYNKENLLNPYFLVVN